MDTSIATKPCASATVNAVSLAVEDMGVMNTKFGKKPMVKFAFETDQVNEYGTKRRLTRLFHRHTHPMSAVSVAVKSWCGRDLAAEEDNVGEVDWQQFVGLPARLKIEPGKMKDGRRYENIVAILPPADDAPEAVCEPKECN